VVKCWRERKVRVCCQDIGRTVSEPHCLNLQTTLGILLGGCKMGCLTAEAAAKPPAVLQSQG